MGSDRPGDVGVLVVYRRRMDEQDRRALLAGLLQISGSRNKARPVELTVVVRSEIRPWRYPPTGHFLYGEWLRAEYEAGEAPSRSRCPIWPWRGTATPAPDSWSDALRAQVRPHVDHALTEIDRLCGGLSGAGGRRMPSR